MPPKCSNIDRQVFSLSLKWNQVGLANCWKVRKRQVIVHALFCKTIKWIFIIHQEDHSDADAISPVNPEVIALNLDSLGVISPTASSQYIYLRLRYSDAYFTFGAGPVIPEKLS